MARRRTQPREKKGMRILFLVLVIILVVVYLVATKRIALPFGPSAPASGPQPAQLAAPSGSRSEVRIASWNIRTLSKRKGDAHLRVIADMISRFDLVAVQEPKDTEVLDRISALLPGWTYSASEAVGRGTSKEHYAFFWDQSRVSQIGAPSIVRDPDDLLMREPYAATFRSGRFDFTLCTIHLLFGSSPSERREELVLMDEVVASVQEANGAEQDVLLMGDFNFPPDDRGWQLTRWTAVIGPPLRTTVGDVSLYDNIWFDPRTTKEYTGKYGVVKFDVDDYGGDTDRARREISDHRPIWAVFSTLADDDPDEYGDLSRARVTRTARLISVAPGDAPLEELLAACGWARLMGYAQANLRN